MSTARGAKVSAAVKSIREFWALGRPLLRRPHEKVYGERVNQTAAEATGVNPDTVGKARKFSHEYTADDLKALCRMIEGQTGQDDGLSVYGRTHVIRLRSVPATRRPGIQERAIREGWSLSVLEQQIAVRVGSRTTGGRNRRVPADGTGQLAQVGKMCDTWARWVRAVEARESAAKATRLSDVPEHLRELIGKATEALKALGDGVAEEMARRRAAKKRR